MNKSIFLIAALALISCSSSHAAEAAMPEKEFNSLPLVFSENFENGIERWEVLDPKTWRLSKGDKNTTFEITERESEYKPPHRSPWHVALVKDIEVSDFVLDFKVRSTRDTGAHRDCCVFFCFQDAANFYYVHLGARPDPHSGQIMIVQDAPRKALTENKKPTPWDDGWHQVRLVFESQPGSISIYFDDMKEPHMTVTNKTIASGRVGVGSFDDCNEFDDVRLYGNTVESSKETN